MNSQRFFKIIRQRISSVTSFCKSFKQGRFPRAPHKPKESGNGKYLSFLIKFLFLSTILYLLWIPFASAYFSLILKITAVYFEIVGIEISSNPSQDFIYSQGIRSCIPPFVALMLATLEKKTLPRINTQKIFNKAYRLYFPSKIFLKGVSIGVLILFIFHVILQISYVYLLLPSKGELYSVFVIFLSGTLRVALPFLLWFALMYKQLFSLSGKGTDKSVYICPFCGAEKIGILDHIKDAHGEEVLKSEEVKKLV